MKKEKILSHLLHEIEMFIVSYNNRSMKIAYECFLLHFRNLYEFFKEKKEYETDINYLDIINEKINHDLKKYKGNVIRINKCLSHLTKDRINKYENKPDYPFDPMYIDVIKYLKVLSSYVNSDPNISQESKNNLKKIIT
jgi:hypothetical protein